MSDETPDVAPEAPAPEAASPEPGAPEAAPEAAPVESESGEVDISSLPPATQEYIRELREEAKTGRIVHDPFKKAFSHFNQQEQEYLLNLVDTLGVNQDAGAEAMRRLSHQLLGIEEAADEVANDAEAIEEAAQAGMTEDQYRQMVREEMHQEQILAEIYDETRAAGFDPESDEAMELWDLAVALNEKDLVKVAALWRQAKGIEEPAAEEPAPEPEPEPLSAQFPKTATIPTGTGGTNAEETVAPPKLGSDELRERVRRRLEAASQPG